MKTLKDFASDINKCSKCGLCQSVCPVYKETGNDCAVSRGKFVMLGGVLKGDLKLNKTINKYLDLCLKCGKCKDFCPSNIDVCKIFETAKFEYARKTFLGKFIWALESKYIFDSCLNILGRVQKLLSGGLFRKRLKALPAAKKLRLVYFKGCVNKVYPKVENALMKVLSFYDDIEIIEKEFSCCGLPFLSSGNIERFEEVKKHNLELLNCDYDYVLTDCASCEDTLKSYGLEKVLNAADFIAKYPKKFIFKKPVKVTFHKPCHLQNIDFLAKVLEMCENVEYIAMQGMEDCCGFAGEFAMKNNKISRAIGRKKAKNIIDTGADYVLSLCPSCTLGLHQGFVANKNFKHPEIKNLIEFLALAEKII